MTDCNPSYTLIASKTKLEPNKGLPNKEHVKWFQSVIGSLLYITLGTRPDIAYSVIKLSRYLTNPS
jgi:hypothetical protein